MVIKEQNIDNLAEEEHILKIFGDDAGKDKITLEGGSTNWIKEGTQTIDTETFNVYKGSNINSNIKILIDEDVSIESDI